MPTYTNTTRFALRKPATNQKVNDFTALIGALGDDVDAKLLGYSSGLASARPAAGIAGRIYRATDTGAWSADTGSAWIVMYSPTPSWTTATLTSPWTNSAGTTAYLKDSLGFVHLKGRVQATAGTGGGNLVAVLPSGYRPGQNDLYACAGNVGSTPQLVELSIDTVGDIVMFPAASGAIEIGLGGITFLAEN